MVRVVNPIAIIPAIDLKDGRCVRLRQGRMSDAVVYSDDPVKMARHWVKEGAQIIHVVDLDGAIQGQPVHMKVIGRMVAAAGVPIEVGGGLRSDSDIQQMLDLGVSRVVLGTRAWAESEQLKGIIAKFADRIVIGIDARDGLVQVKGWTETTGMKAVELAWRANGFGARWIIYTDTSRDGMLQGVNARAMDDMCKAVTCSVIASGGISSVNDVRALKALNRANLAGAIVGKALYEGRVTLKDLINA